MTQTDEGAATPPPGELRELRMRLATARAGIADLQAEWDTTVELARHLRGRQRDAGRPDSTAAVLVDLEISMRASAPLPRTLPPATPVAELRRAVHRAERDYDRLISQHLTYAREALDRDPALPGS
jgi:hypothetical protein